MPATLQLVAIPTIKIAGQAASSEFHNAIISIEVDDTVLMPSMFTVRLKDQIDSNKKYKWIDGTDADVGKSIEIAMQGTTVLVGEITAIEPEFDQFNKGIFAISGYDKSFRLHRGKKTRVFLQKKDSDIASEIASGCGLTSQVDDTGEVYQYLCQDNKSDMDFLKERAAVNGYFLYCQQGKLFFVKKPTTNGPDLTWGEELLDFKARLTAAEQVDSVRVRAWDPIKKEEIVGQVTSPDDKPGFGGETKTGGDMARTAFGASETVVNALSVVTAGAARVLAQAVSNEKGNSFVQAEGTCVGTPGLHSGMTVNLKKLGTRFSGKYRLTRVIHRWGKSEYLTCFEVSGRRANTLGEILSTKENHASLGPVLGIVTNNKDPKALGRVKVKIPTFKAGTQDTESDWARLVSPMAGKECGVEFIPEVNDEVLVAFENGDFNRPYVLGSLWNNSDKPPLPNKGGDTEAVGGDGKVNQRIIQSRSKHKFILDDSQGKEKISLVDKTTKNKFEIDSTKNLFSIQADKKIEVKTTNGTTITIENDGQKITLTCAQASIGVDGSNGVEIKGGGASSLKCTAQEIQISSGPGSIKIGPGGVEINGGPKVAINGAMVNINNGALEVV